VKAYAIVGAHTHKSFGRRVGGILIANAGSVGRSYEGKPGRATYVVLEDRTGVWALEIRHLTYDMRGNLRDIQNKGVPLSKGLLDAFMTAQAPPEKSSRMPSVRSIRSTRNPPISRGCASVTRF